MITTHVLDRWGLGGAEHARWGAREAASSCEAGEAEVGRGRDQRGRVAAGVAVIDRSGRKISATVVACVAARDRRASGILRPE
jgi:hypothetical protein